MEIEHHSHSYKKKTRGFWWNVVGKMDLVVLLRVSLLTFHAAWRIVLLTRRIIFWGYLFLLVMQACPFAIMSLLPRQFTAGGFVRLMDFHWLGWSGRCQHNYARQFATPLLVHWQAAASTLGDCVCLVWYLRNTPQVNRKQQKKKD